MSGNPDNSNEVDPSDMSDTSVEDPGDTYGSVEAWTLLVKTNVNLRTPGSADLGREAETRWRRDIQRSRRPPSVETLVRYWVRRAIKDGYGPPTPRDLESRYGLVHKRLDISQDEYWEIWQEETDRVDAREIAAARDARRRKDAEDLRRLRGRPPRRRRGSGG